jgi:DNA-binding protein Fis
VKDKTDSGQNVPREVDSQAEGGGKSVLDLSIGNSIDTLVEYLVDNDIRGIHPLIMGEVEKRLIIKVLERSRGNKVQAARWLGMSRNTFHRKIQKLVDNGADDESQSSS